MFDEAAAPYKISWNKGLRGGFSALEAKARARKLTLSEWVRAELLEPKGGENGAGTEVVLGEVLALRTILINLSFSLLDGKLMAPERFGADRAKLKSTSNSVA